MHFPLPAALLLLCTAWWPPCIAFLPPTPRALRAPSGKMGYRNIGVKWLHSSFKTSPVKTALSAALAAAPPRLTSRDHFSETLRKELLERRPQYTLDRPDIFIAVKNGLSIATTGYFVYKLTPVAARRAYRYGLNYAAELVSPFVPLFIRRDPALRRLERNPKFYDRFVAPTSIIRPFNVTTREALDYVVENRDALMQLAMLIYSTANYVLSRNNGIQ